MKALIQSYSRTKARNLAEYKKVMERTPTRRTTRSMRTPTATSRTSTRTSFPSAIRSSTGPSRSTAATRPPSGTACCRSTRRRTCVNPPNGWVYNTNNYPFSAAGAEHSPKQKDFPAYVDSGSENPRGIHAIRVLDGKKGFTLDSLIAAAYDSYLPEFEVQIPLLLKAYDAAPASNPLKAKLAEPIALLQGLGLSLGGDVGADLGGDFLRRGSVAARHAGGAQGRRLDLRVHASRAPPRSSGSSRWPPASTSCTADFGKWQTPWGDINRFQRNDRRHRAEVRRQQAEHAGDVHVGALGIAGVVRRARLSRHEEVVRHQRQQLRGGGRVRRSGEGQGGDRRRPEQRSRRRSTSTIRRSATPPATCATCISIASSSRDTPSGSTSRGSSPIRTS